MDNLTASPPLLRRLNAEIVLEHLRGGGPRRVTQLVNLTGLSRPTVESIADDLVNLGWVTESILLPGQRRGRPARELSFRADGGIVLGLDVGVRRVTAIVADLDGIIRNETVAPLDPELSAAARIRMVADTATSAIQSAGFPLIALMHTVVGSPGIVDVSTGRVTKCEIMPGWTGLDLATELQRALPSPVTVENDANLAAAGERWKGIASGVDDLVFVLAGERLGAGIVVDGRPLRGHADGAGEMGFTSLFDTGSGSEGIGALARDAGGEALEHLLSSQADDTSKGQLLRSLAGDDPRRVNTEVLLQAASLGDEVARDVLETILVRIARALAVLAAVLNPEMIVVGGAVADAAEDLLVPLRHHLEQFTLLPTRLEASVLSHRAVALGAVHQALTVAAEGIVGRPAPLSPS